MRVLLVENNKTVIRKFKEAFEGSEHKLTVSESTLAGVAHTTKVRFDLIVCGPLNKYSDGLSFATDHLASDHKVLIVAKKRKYSKVPFLCSTNLTKQSVLEATLSAVRGG